MAEANRVTYRRVADAREPLDCTLYVMYVFKNQVKKTHFIKKNVGPPSLKLQKNGTKYPQNLMHDSLSLQKNEPKLPSPLIVLSARGINEELI